MNNMTKVQSRSGFLSWSVALLLGALAAGCGSGDNGRDPILGAGDIGVPVPRVAPTVTLVAPVPNATNVPINTKLITATFSVAMDAATLTAGSFTLACPAGTPVTGTVSYLASGRIATLTLPAAANLPANVRCTATVTTGARSQVDGFPLASNFVWSFTTGAAPDTTAPTVTGTVNANGATGVAINTRVGVTFSELMDPATITEANFSLKNTATGVSQIGILVPAGVSLIFQPAGNLANSTNYTVTIKGGASGVKDLAGNPMAADYVYSWTTAAAAVALDTTAPTVTGTIHTNGQTNVAVNTRVGATFSEAMNPLTITNTNFNLKQTTTGAVVPGVVTYSGVTAVFIPLNNLANSTNYTVTVKGGADGVEDLAGNPMTSDFSISWTTGAAADTTAPTVSSTVPVNGGTSFPISNLVNATFSEAMDPLTVTNLIFTLKQTASGTAVAGTVGSSGVSALFFPAANLASSTNYTATIKGGADGASDLAGNPMASDYVWTFTTAAAIDNTAPTVTGTINANGAINVATNTNVGATFSEAMNPLTITNLNLGLKVTSSGAAVAGVTTYSGVTAVFNPLVNLAANTNYTATVKGGAGGVKDLAGNPMTADFVWSWTTGATPDTSLPFVTATVPASFAINFPISNLVNVTFSEALNPLTVTNLNFFVKQTTTGAAVAGTVGSSGVSALFFPAANLASNTNYTATLKGGASGLKDLAGNAMQFDYVWTFTTAGAPDATAPTVVGTVNANGAINVPINTKLGATFSEAMNPFTVTNVNFTARATASGAAVAGTVNYSGVSAVFVPASNLTPNTNYTVTIKGGASGVKDLAGNPMASDFVISWTTAATADAGRPTVTANFPLANATGVALNVRPSASFSEAMDPLTISTATMKLVCEGSTGLGTVTYAVTGSAATFVPEKNLVNGANCTATITTGAEDLAGNAIASDFVWKFRTVDLVALPPPPGVPPNVGPAPVDLQTAGNFAIMATTGITNVHTSSIIGDIGTSPAPAATMDNVFCSEIVGTIYGVDPGYTGSGVQTCFTGDAAAKTLIDNAIGHMRTAYGDAAGRATPTAVNLHAGFLGGKTIPPGLYKYSIDVLVDSDVTLAGTSNDVWIFQISGDLNFASKGDLALGVKVVLSGGALSKNIFWQVGGPVGATLGTFAQVKGNLLSAKQVVMQTGAVLIGRSLSETTTTLQMNTIAMP